MSDTEPTAVPADPAAPADPGGSVAADAGEQGAAGVRRPAPAPARAEAVDVHPPTRLERTSYGVLRFLALGLAKLWLGLRIEGRDRVPRHGPFIVAPVHRSNIDFILASLVTPTRMRYMGKASIWKWRMPGRFFSMLGAFPVHRGTADRESLRTCTRIIENGEPLVMFPEGTRRSGPVLDEMFDGAAYLSARTGVPLVPLGIGGSEAAMPAGAKLIKRRKVVLVIGEPIVPPRGDGSGRVPRRVVRELTDELGTAIQARFDEARALSG